MATPTGCYTYSELNRMRYEEFQRAEIRAKTEAKVRERENMLENIRLVCFLLAVAINFTIRNKKL